MGYETKLVIGIPSAYPDKDGGIWFNIFAELDMCKMGAAALISKLNWQNTSPDTYWYYYVGENDDKITEDKYGDKSRAVPISFVIEALEKDVVQDDYSRFTWALALLKAMDASNGYKDLSVMFYGH